MKNYSLVIIPLLAALGAPAMAAAPSLPDSTGPDAIQGWCNENGGVYSPPSTGGVYVCLLPDGEVVVCSGNGTPERICTLSTRTVDLPPRVPRGSLDMMLAVQTSNEVALMKQKIQSIEEKVDLLITQQCPILE